MDQKKLEKLTNIKNYLENDDINGLNKYIERIKPTVKNDEDFQEIFEELQSKDYDQALFLTEEFIFSTDDNDLEDNYDKMDLEDLDGFEDKEDLELEEPDEDFEDLTDDQFDDLSLFDDKDDDDF